MDERKRMLATAWRDLAGDAPVTSPSRKGGGWPKGPEDMLPDVDAPANWGVWLAWCFARDLSADIVPQMPRGSGRFAISVDGRHYVGTFAQALLCAVLEMSWESLPPSVTAWWEAEQQRTRSIVVQESRSGAVDRPEGTDG